MSNAFVLVPNADRTVHPVIRKITWRDLADSLRKGFADFSARPTHLVFLCLIYPIAGLMIARAVMRTDLLPLLFPLAAGFALIGPFAAIGLYELSRRRDQGLDSSWARVFGLIHAPSLRPIFEIGLLLAVVFVAWLGAAQVIYDHTLGPNGPTSPSQFATALLTTGPGWALIVIGNLVGCVFAGLALAIGVVSLPFLVDRNVGFSTALATSMRCVAANPVILSLWGLIVAALLLVGTIPLFVGLAVVLPVLGHATWHLYRKLVDNSPL